MGAAIRRPTEGDVKLSLQKHFELGLAGKLDVRGVGVGRGEYFAALAELLEVMDEEPVEVAFGFMAAVAISNATGHVWRIGEIAGTGFFDNDEIFFHGTMRDPKPSGARICRHRNIGATYEEGEIENGCLRSTIKKIKSKSMTELASELPLH